MLFHRSLVALMAAWILCLGGCSPQDKPTKQEVTIEALTRQAQGFVVGSVMNRNTVYVFFDPQCPHCGHLWEASRPLQSKIKFVWIPIKLINGASAAQGAALLAAADPQAAMSEHEASLLSGRGGISASSSIPAEIENAIKKNTDLFNTFSAESVPFIVAKNARTGLVVTREGALDTGPLAEFLGIDAP